MKEAAEELGQRFKWYCEALRDMSLLRELKGQEKLDAYDLRTEEAWASLATAFPEDAEQQRKEHEVLRERQRRSYDEAAAAGMRDVRGKGTVAEPDVGELPRTPTDPDSVSAALSRTMMP